MDLDDPVPTVFAEADFSARKASGKYVCSICGDSYRENVLPALGNEFIVLLKETSVSGYIALEDLTKGGDIIRSQTYSPYFPLLSVAFIYLILVIFLSFLLKLLERRLRNSER